MTFQVLITVTVRDAVYYELHYNICCRLMLHGREWSPGLEELVSAKREAFNVAACLDVAPITGLEATKRRFMTDITQASVVHIGEYYLMS